jgi:hypothetical protein
MSGGQYVAAAYGVVLVVVLAYVAIIAAKLQRLERDAVELLERMRRPPAEGEAGRTAVYAAGVQQGSEAEGASE